MNKPLLLATLLAGVMAVNPASAAPWDSAEIQGIAKLRGEAFEQAVNKIGYDAFPRIARPDLWRLLLVAEANEVEDQSYSSGYMRILQEFAKRGEPEDLPHLLKFFDSPAQQLGIQAQYVDTLYQIAVRAQIQQQRWPTPVQLPPVTATLPPELESAAPELKAAWLYYERIIHPFQIAFPSEKRNTPYIPISQNYPLFFKKIGAAFRGETDGAPEKLNQFAWSDMCGTGFEFFREPQINMIFLGLWQQKRYAEAVGALIETRNIHNFRSSSNTDWSREFFKRAGIDWELLAVGSILHGKWGAKELGEFGSDAAVGYVTALAKVPSVAQRPDYLHLVAGYITPGSTPLPRVNEPAEPRRVPDEVQQQLLALLHAAAASKTDVSLRDTALEQICVLRHPDSLPFLHKLMAVPQYAVRRKAYEALTLMGEPVKEPAQPQPVKFRLLANGAPIAGANIHWATLSQSNSRVSSTAVTDESGILSLPRDYLVDTSVPLDGVELRFDDPKAPATPSFILNQPLPPNLDAVSEVNVPVTQIQLLVSGGPNFKTFGATNLVADLTIQREVKQSDYAYFQNYSVGRKVNLGQPQNLKLVHGKYQFVLDVPGGQRWVSGPLEVQGATMPLKAEISPGVDLKFEIIAPGGELRDKTVASEIWREGKQLEAYSHFDYITNTYRSLPLGTYEIRIKSSAERNTVRHNLSEIATHPPYQGKTVTVVLNGSKPTVDLGQIVLAAVKLVP